MLDKPSSMQGVCIHPSSSFGLLHLHGFRVGSAQGMGLSVQGSWREELLVGLLRGPTSSPFLVPLVEIFAAHTSFLASAHILKVSRPWSLLLHRLLNTALGVPAAGSPPGQPHQYIPNTHHPTDTILNPARPQLFRLLSYRFDLHFPPTVGSGTLNFPYVLSPSFSFWTETLLSFILFFFQFYVR